MNIAEHVPLGRLTTFGAGGAAAAFAATATEAELHEALVWAAERERPVAAIGLGSNLLVADDGFDGLAVRLEGALAAVELGGGALLSAGGGATNAVCLHRARSAGLGGFEFACAIPGTVGGGVRMNGGAYGGDFSDVVTEAVVVDAAGPRRVAPDELGFAYRASSLRPGQIVASVVLDLEPRPPDEIKAKIKELNALRKAAQPTNKRTFGSVFKNPPHELTAGRMLEACGLRGYRVGGAQISPKHANFIENAGDATSADAIALMTEARRRAREQFGVELEHEVQLLGALDVAP